MMRIPDRAEDPGEAGLFLWGRVPEGVDVDVLVKDAWQHGGHVRLTRYLEQRLQALAQGHGALRRLARA